MQIVDIYLFVILICSDACTMRSIESLVTKRDMRACVCVRACRANRSRGDFLNLGNGRAMSTLFLCPLSIAVDHGCRLSSSLHAFASSIMARRPRNRRQSRVQRQTGYQTKYWRNFRDIIYLGE